MKKYFNTMVLFLCLVGSLTVVIHRGLYGEYTIGIHSFNVSFILLLPVSTVFVSYRKQKVPTSLQRMLSIYRSCFIVITLSIAFAIYYLSRNGLWCAQHPKIIPAMCEKLHQFADFAKLSNITSWWLTMGDLLAIERGHNMPLPWEHDIDVCITSDQYSILLKAIQSNPNMFNAIPEFQKEGHWYLPIDMAKLGLLSTEHRTAEGVNVDVWTCPKLQGNITQAQYCNGVMNVPESKAERRSLLTQFYGNYSVVKYSHHAWMCTMWTG